MKAGGRAGTRSPPCTTRMLVPTMEWNAFLNTSLPTLHHQRWVVDGAQHCHSSSHGLYVLMMGAFLTFLLIARTLQLQVAQTPGCASSPVFGMQRNVGHDCAAQRSNWTSFGLLTRQQRNSDHKPGPELREDSLCLTICWVQGACLLLESSRLPHCRQCCKAADRLPLGVVASSPGGAEGHTSHISLGVRHGSPGGSCGRRDACIQHRSASC